MTSRGHDTDARITARAEGVRRLLRMSWPELKCRGLQEVLKRVERAQTIATRTRRRSEENEAATAALSRFVAGERPFFPGAFDDTVAAAVRDRAPAFVEEVVDEASSLLDERFDLFGYSGLRFGSPIRWRFDPVSGRESPLVHWSRIDPSDHARGGDAKVVWELNRQQWLLRLGQAYRLTGDDRYASAAVAFIAAWIDENPPRMGINWASSLESAIRSISWCWTLSLLRGAPAITDRVLARAAASLRDQALHIERYLSTYFSPNTHLTGEALGLLYTSIALEGSPAAGRWRRKAVAILNAEAARQVLPDGVYFEQSTCYQRYTADTYLHFVILASACGIEVPRIVEERLRAMLDFLAAVRQPDGSVPRIGDDDGGTLLPLGRRRPGDFSALFSTAAVWFAEPSYAWAAGALDAESIWMLGSSAAAKFDQVEPRPPDRGGVRLFPAGGYAVMASGRATDSHMLTLDAGPLGCPFSSGHGHADMLSVQCSAFGRPVIVDTGTHSYSADKRLRSYFRSARAHSTVVVGERQQPESTGPFAWSSRPAATMSDVRRGDGFEEVAGSLRWDLEDGTRVAHSRRVIFVRREFWVIVDEIDGSSEQKIEARFQLAAGLEANLADNAVEIAVAPGQKVLLRTASAAGVDMRLHCGSEEPFEGWTSPHFGVIAPAPVAVATVRATLPVRLFTFIVPAAAAAISDLGIEIGSDGRSVEVQTRGSVDRISIGQPGEVVVEHRAGRPALTGV